VLLQESDAVRFPFAANIVIKFGRFSVSQNFGVSSGSNIALPYNELECRCGAGVSGVSFCETGLNDTVTCDADGTTNVNCSTCQQG
jgi:hypothetical protein